MDYTAHFARVINRLGVDTTWTPLVGSPKSIKGVYSNSPSVVNLATGEVGSVNPTVSFAAGDVANIVEGDAVTVGGINYTIVALDPDSVGGWVTCDLKVT